ncbi:arsenate reductase ArsC [Lysobacter sp. TAF61]|uniref:arsenate reductase ArsC n=1 Tax=Lysobacter sp. TAF61 TaxID=3233072 RepID=UPI003F996C1B
MKDRYNVLFVCTGNSARSQMAEALGNSLGKGRIRAYSAGSHPAGLVQPMALKVMSDAGLDVSVLRSKSWAEFAQPGAPEMDLVITVCDRAAGESCPVWPGQPITAHWSIPDPMAVTGTQEQIHKAFSNTLLVLQQRISLLLSLRMEALDRLAAETKLRQISEAPATA